MAIQLGFGDSIRLTSSDDVSLQECLKLTGEKYRAYSQAIDVGESDKATYWRIVFSILSVHSPLDATFEAYTALRLWRARFKRTPSQQTLRSLLLHARGVDGIVQYTYQKSSYIRAFDFNWNEDKSRFLRNGDTDDAWRIRIQANVKGLGLAKASFAVALSNPSTSDVCCVDTHIWQLFTGTVPKSTIARKAYLAIESRIRELGKEYGLSTFACSWALWDAKRGVSNSHAALATT